MSARRIGVLVLSGLSLLAGLAPPARAEHIVRIRSVRTGEVLTVRFTAVGCPALLGWRRVNRLFRTRAGARRTIHPRLLRTLGHIQRRFDAAEVLLLSGYRTRDTWQRDSYHQVGRAADIRIEGVTNRALFDACVAMQRRGARLGCGYYPRGRHVHVDVRGRPALWVDVSAPRARPRYVASPRRWLEQHR